MSKLYNTFEFIGNLFISNNKEKFHEIKEYDSGWVKERLSFAVQESKTNSVFVEIEGGYSKANKIKCFHSARVQKMKKDQDSKFHGKIG
ncbi:hypothetical protein [Bacillus velezensis]|uniref:hypothetical protein n=1 Tax=Bacillus velezensis TaxID=492670 RepID=UPI003EBDB1A9